MRRFVPYLLVLVAYAALLWWLLARVADIERRVASTSAAVSRMIAVEAYEEARHAGRDKDMTCTWTSGGLPYAVTLARNPGESDADFRQRLFDAVTAEQLKYPPD